MTWRIKVGGNVLCKVLSFERWLNMKRLKVGLQKFIKQAVARLSAEKKPEAAKCTLHETSVSPFISSDRRRCLLVFHSMRFFYSKARYNAGFPVGVF